jgi:hypothetical protein
MLRESFGFIVVASLLVGCAKKAAPQDGEASATQRSAVVAADGTCWCDEFCKDFGDCCASASQCAVPARTERAQALAPIGSPCTTDASCQSNVCRGVCTITCDLDNAALCQQLARDARAPHPELAACTEAAASNVCDLSSATASAGQPPTRARRASPVKQASAGARPAGRRD